MWCLGVFKIDAKPGHGIVNFKRGLRSSAPWTPGSQTVRKLLPETSFSFNVYITHWQTFQRVPCRITQTWKYLDGKAWHEFWPVLIRKFTTMISSWTKVDLEKLLRGPKNLPLNRNAFPKGTWVVRTTYTCRSSSQTHGFVLEWHYRRAFFLDGLEETEQICGEVPGERCRGLWGKLGSVLEAKSLDWRGIIPPSRLIKTGWVLAL